MAKHSAWERIFENKREYRLTVGRSVGDRCLVHIDISSRPDRYWFGHGVGWSPSLAAYLDYATRRANPPIYPRSGSLRKLLTLEKPRDFDNPQMSLSISSLFTPFVIYDLETQGADVVQESMLREIDVYALPYLCLMLKFRHGVTTTPEALGSSAKLVP